MCKVKVIDYKEQEEIKPVNCPCKDCTQRQVGCHSMCSPYNEYADYRKKIRDRHFNDKQVFDCLYNKKGRRA